MKLSYQKVTLIDTFEFTLMKIHSFCIAQEGDFNKHTHKLTLEKCCLIVFFAACEKSLKCMRNLTTTVILYETVKEKSHDVFENFIKLVTLRS